MISYWEQTALVEYDLVVIGAGITGIFCALTYRKKYPNGRIAILERGLFSEGASTKNAGFACFGSLSELLEDRQIMGDEALLELVHQRREGLALLKNTLNEKAIGLELNGGYELFFEKNPLELEKLESINTLLYPLFNTKVFQPNNSKINSFGLDSEKVKHLIENPFEGGLHTGKLMRNLRLKANSLKIEIFSHTWVEEIDTSNTQTQIQLKNHSIKIKTHKLAVCTNGFAAELIPELKINPGRGMVLITSPIKKLKPKGTFHYQKGYYYFRSIENRILLGGGRNLDFKNEETTDFGINPKIKAQLTADLKQFILPQQPFSIAMEWSGIMGFGTEKTPIIRKINESIAVGVRLGGMGVAIGSKIGASTAALLMDS